MSFRAKLKHFPLSDFHRNSFKWWQKCTINFFWRQIWEMSIRSLYTAVFVILTKLCKWTHFCLLRNIAMKSKFYLHMNVWLNVMGHYVIHVCFEFITDSGLISHSKGRPVRKVKSSVRVNGNLTLSEPNLIPMGEKDLVLCPDVFFFVLAVVVFAWLLKMWGFLWNFVNWVSFPWGLKCPIVSEVLGEEVSTCL